MRNNDLREAIARAIWTLRNDEVSWDAIVQLAANGDTYMIGQVDFVRQEADAALAVTREELKEPTLEMAAAMRNARMNIEGGYGGPSSWEAGLAASPLYPEQAMVEPLPRYNELKSCQKCGCQTVSTHYRPEDRQRPMRYNEGDAREHLLRRCTRCGFEWIEAPLYPENHKEKACPHCGAAEPSKGCKSALFGHDYPACGAMGGEQG